MHGDATSGRPPTICRSCLRIDLTREPVQAQAAAMSEQRSHLGRLDGEVTSAAAAAALLRPPCPAGALVSETPCGGDPGAARQAGAPRSCTGYFVGCLKQRACSEHTTPRPSLNTFPLCKT